VELRRKLTYWLVAAAFLLAAGGLFVGYVVHEERSDTEGRIVARFVLCRELESIKSAQRSDLTEKIDDAEGFLRANPKGLPLPGLGTTEIRRSIARNRRLRKSLAPYPDGCAAFAREPSNLDVEVPTVETGN
jgi:hypothetical protein